MRAERHEWQTVDFRPVTGWRTIHLTADSGVIALPMPGWLIQEEIGITTAGDSFVVKNAAKRITSGVLQDGVVEPAIDSPDFWLALYWSDAGPGPAEEKLERAARRTLAERFPDVTCT
jgi:hypothetical protein